ncbi:putative RNA-directed DNA polymerase [Helianthus annuus]|nr:putative RNA-directed DNA polymerase [Helianthus annuus]
MIRRLNDIIRALLAHAHIPTTYWVEVLHTTAYLHNILPTTRLNYNTPTFALYLCHPTYDHLRVFGSACYPNFSATESNKLKIRSTRCIFLGYPPSFRGYWCLVPSTGKVHISSNVDFDETSFPFSTPLPHSTYQFLDDDPPTHTPYQFPSSTLTQQQPIANHELPPTTPPTTHHTKPPPTPPSEPSPLPPEPIPQPTNANLNTHPMTSRGKQGITKPNPKYNLYTDTISPLPTSHLKALTDQNWQRAMLSEFKALLDNGTWVYISCNLNRL